MRRPSPHWLWRRSLICSSVAVAAQILVGSGHARADTLPSARALLSAYRCPVLEKLGQIAATKPETTRDRFITLWPESDPGSYVQCIFTEKNATIFCEAASGAFDGPNGPSRNPAVEARLATLGFTTGLPGRNHERLIPLGEPPDLRSVADFMLLALHAYGLRSWMGLDFKAPFGRKGDACAATS